MPWLKGYFEDRVDSWKGYSVEDRRYYLSKASEAYLKIVGEGRRVVEDHLRELESDDKAGFLRAIGKLSSTEWAEGLKARLERDKIDL